MSSFSCFALLALCVSARAQVIGYKSPVTTAAERLVALTKDDYYSHLMFSKLAATVNPCAITLCGARALPVRLISFSGERVDAENVALYWETSLEVNNDHFEVERAINPGRGYETVDIVKGAGSSTSAVKYKTADPNDYTGYTYYRLKQVDLDGTFEYSSVIAVKGGLTPLTIKAFPNPVQSGIIRFRVTGLKVSEKLVVMIYDVSGRIIYQNSNITLSSDKQIFQVNLLRAVPGKYVINIKSKDRSATGTFVVIAD